MKSLIRPPRSAVRKDGGRGEDAIADPADLDDERVGEDGGTTPSSEAITPSARPAGCRYEAVWPPVAGAAP